MNPVRTIRAVAGWTQAHLARAAGTSQPTVAAYEAETKSPSWRTTVRLAEAADLACLVFVGAPLTRDQARSLALHAAVGSELTAHPEPVLAAARTNLARMRVANPRAVALLDEWDRILALPTRRIVSQLLDPSEHGRDLRQLTPFAGVLDPRHRAAVYRSFRDGA